MSKYVDKVVFNLHETFPKPKRGKIKDVLMGVSLKSFYLETDIKCLIDTIHSLLAMILTLGIQKKRLWKYQFATFAIHCMLKDYQTSLYSTHF